MRELKEVRKKRRNEKREDILIERNEIQKKMKKYTESAREKSKSAIS